MNFLILGCRGFIGSYISDYFLAHGNQIYGCDLVEYSTTQYKYHKISILSSDFEEIFHKENFDVCINASGSGNVSFSIQHPLSDFDSNTYSVAKVLDTIRKYQPACRYLHISSAAVYGNPKHLPVRESDETAPLSPYGFNKLMSEQLCSAYYKMYQLPIAIIRPFSVFGNELKKQLLWDICSKLMATDVVELFGTGKESRDFIHIHDLTSLIDLVITKSDFRMDIYNAASGTETTVQDIARLFEKYFDNSKTILFSGQHKKGYPLNWRAEIEKVKGLGFTNKTSLEKGISEYIDWFKRNLSEQQ